MNQLLLLALSVILAWDEVGAILLDEALDWGLPSIALEELMDRIKDPILDYK